MAEVAYSVAHEWQRRGISSLIQEMLVQTAREQSIGGIVAFTTPGNRGMIRLFEKLPFVTRNSYDGEVLALTARFDEPKPSAERCK